METLSRDMRHFEQFGTDLKARFCTILPADIKTYLFVDHDKIHHTALVKKPR